MIVDVQTKAKVKTLNHSKETFSARDMSRLLKVGG